MEKDGRGGKWRGLLIRARGEGRGWDGKKRQRGSPGYTVPPGSRGARIVTAVLARP